MLNTYLEQACQGGDNQLWMLQHGWIQNRRFYLVFTVVASEPHLLKVQQKHLLWVLSQPGELITFLSEILTGLYRNHPILIRTLYTGVRINKSWVKIKRAVWSTIGGTKNSHNKELFGFRFVKTFLGSKLNSFAPSWGLEGTCWIICPCWWLW